MMYNDENSRRSLWSGLGGFLIRFLIVAFFLGLVLWLYPFPKQYKLPNLKTFYDDVFNRNVQTMRDAAVNWYTVDKLPKEDDQTYKLTLQDMLDKKLILPFTDKNGEACDTYGSYVTVTKVPGKVEYKFKFNLNCPASGQEDYILEYRGCYDLCTNNCTKPQITKPIRVVKHITYPKEDKPHPKVIAYANSCIVTNDEFGTAVIRVTRISSDKTFNYTIKVRQPGGWFYSTVASGTLSKSNPSVTKYVVGTNNGNLSYQVYINGKLYKTGTVNLNECHEPVVEPEPIVTAGVNSCLITGNNFSSIIMSVTRGENDPSFTYSMRVRQPGSWIYNNVASGTISISNPSVTRYVIGTGEGTMYYQVLINGVVYRQGSVNIDKCTTPEVEYEYLHKRDVQTKYWTAFSDWSLTQSYNSTTRQVQTIEYYRGYKWIPAYTYEYKHYRVVSDGYTAWSGWSSWTTTSHSSSSTKDVETRTVSDKNQTGTKVTYGSWYYTNKERRTSMYSSIYNTGSSSTATEYRQYLGTVAVRDCSSCGVTVYYEYSIYKRSKSSTPIYNYDTHREYRYRTRSPKSKIEYIWSNDKTLSGWTYMNLYRITADNGYYAESGWLMLSDWNTLVVKGYTFYQKRTYYTYSDLITTTHTEYKWTRNISESGWIYTGTFREI